MSDIFSSFFNPEPSLKKFWVNPQTKILVFHDDSTSPSFSLAKNLSMADTAMVDASGAAAASAGPSKNAKPRFEIKKWNAIAVWSWAICTDT